MPKQDEPKFPQTAHEEINELLQIVQPKKWLPLAVVIAILIGVGIWSVVGEIPIDVSGNGVILTERGVFFVPAKSEGIITDVLIEQGDEVQKGDPLAVIYNPKRYALIRQIRATQFKIRQLEEVKEILEVRLEARQELFKEGLIPKTNVEETQQQLIGRKIEIDEGQANLVSLLSDLEKLSPAGSRELQETLQRDLFNPDIHPEEIEKKLSSVLAPEPGNILEVFIQKGSVVSDKDPLAWLEYPRAQDDLLVFYAAIPVQKGDLIREGMEVQIELTTVDPKEYGVLRATVKEVAPFAVSEVELFNRILNKQIVQYLFGKAPAVTLVEIEPIQDPQTASGFAWTSADGPPFPITTGTMGRATILVEHVPPISYLIPLWKVTQPFEGK